MLKNPTEFCRLVEHRLGWVPPAGPEWQRYRTMASRVAKKMDHDPELYTLRNLELAVELLVREKLPRSPLGVFAHVPRAVEQAVEPEGDVEAAIRAACAVEQGRGDPDGWVTRFARAVGPYRKRALVEWRDAQ